MDDLLSKMMADQEEARKVSSDDRLEQIKALCQEATELQAQAESLTEALKVTIGRINRIKQHDLVKLMKESGTGNWQAEDGSCKAKLDTYVSGSLPKEEGPRDDAIGYLVDLGGASLIKTTVGVLFPKSAHNMATEFYSKVLELVKPYDLDEEPTLKEDVHASSLQAFIRQRLKSGEEVDPEKLGCATGQVVKFEFFGPDGKKKKKLTMEDL